MRRVCEFVIAASCFALPLTAQAQVLPADVVITGQSKPALAQAIPGGSWCYLNRGLSSFEASANGSQLVMSFAELTYFDGTTYYNLNGQSRLVFNSGSTTDGVLHVKQGFEYPSVVRNLPFTSYLETKASSILYTVAFSLEFSDCTLPVFINYEIQ